METAELQKNPQMVFTLSSGGFQGNGNATAHIYGQFRVSHSPHMHVFGLREEAGGPGETSRRHRENVPFPHFKKQKKHN